MALGCPLRVLSMTLKKASGTVTLCFLPMVRCFAGKESDRIRCIAFLLFCPQAAGIFQFFPVAPVQIVVLGADVGHVETFLHGFPVPAVVAGRAHVSAVHAGAFIIVGSHSLAFGQVGVGQEFVGTAFPLYQFSGVSSHATQLGILCSRLYEVV